MFGFKNNSLRIIGENDIQAITKQLLDYKVVFHPRIAPDGALDFSAYGPGSYTLLLDRNLVTNLLGICNGEIEVDASSSRVIGTIMFWAKANGIRVNVGVALNEYANFKHDNTETHHELSLFQQIDKTIGIVTWRDIALGQDDSVPKIMNHYQQVNCDFTVESEHYLMNYAQMIRAATLLLRLDLTESGKMIEFLLWNSKNTLFGQYNLIYLAMMFSGRVKRLYKKNVEKVESVLKKCRNQAWDLTYLSIWSTLYWNEKPREEIWLFATMDKSLKKIFSITHDPSQNVFRDCFGVRNGKRLESILLKIQGDRVKPAINEEKIRQLIKSEKRSLEEMIRGRKGDVLK